jgi:hypothetical protein
MSRPTNLPNRGLISQQQLEELAQIQAAIRERKAESLPLFEPMEKQAAFLASHATTRILRGGNRSGKTATGAVEVAHCALGTDPHGKYSPGPKIIWIIGKGEDHVGRVLFEKLFVSGPQSFKVIKDKETKLYRAFRPYLAEDLARISEAKFAPPLIPSRMIGRNGNRKDIAWKNRALNLPSLVRLKNGSVLYFFTSGGDAPMGSAADLIWIDEDIENPGWVPEMRMRLPDRKGRMIWTAWPWSSNDALVDLSKQAESQANWEHPTVQEWVISFTGNKHLDAAAKAEALVDLEFRGEAEVASRDRGEFGFGDAMVFPYFHIDTHGINKEELPGGQVPQEWTRYLCVDPGHTEAAALFIAIPPPGTKYKDMILVYDELYQTKASASTMAKAIEAKARGQEFQAFMIDNHGSRKTEEGSGRTIRWQFQQEFKKLGLRSNATESDFHPGTDDKDGRLTSVREVMRTIDEHPRLRVLRGATPRLLWELERYRFMRDAKTGFITDKPNDKGIHVSICLQLCKARTQTPQPDDFLHRPDEEATVGRQRNPTVLRFSWRSLLVPLPERRFSSGPSTQSAASPIWPSC